jgi:lysophospholipase L1-like esterase
MRPATITALALVLCPIAVVAQHLEQQHDTRNVLVYGDSNTWGWVPTSPVFPTTRYAKKDRWPEIMAEVLGDEYDVVTEGLNGRTTNADDPSAPGLLNGADDLDSAVASHEPLDLVIIMLGSNDLKLRLGRSVNDIAQGMAELVGIVRRDTGLGWTQYERPDVLVISPPPFGAQFEPQIGSAFEGAREKIAALPAAYLQVSEKAGVHFFDAAMVVQEGEIGIDGLHLLVKGNRDLGEAVAAKVLEIFE